MKTYKKPEIVVTSYEVESSIMLKSGVTQTTGTIKSTDYSTIDF